MIGGRCGKRDGLTVGPDWRSLHEQRRITARASPRSVLNRHAEGPHLDEIEPPTYRWPQFGCGTATPICFSAIGIVEADSRSRTAQTLREEIVSKTWEQPLLRV